MHKPGIGGLLSSATTFQLPASIALGSVDICKRNHRDLLTIGTVIREEQPVAEQVFR